MVRTIRYLALILIFGAVLAGTARAAGKPRVVVEPGTGGTRIFVEVEAGNGQVRRSLLRGTPAAVTPGAAGQDPAGRAAFVSWTEGTERWFAASRDQGGSWSEPRAI